MSDLLNTIYIISKGRPDCTTAQTLTKMKYPGEWFIVCGNNDKELPKYQAKWADRVLVFDWFEEVKGSDLLDNFGVETMGSGAVPVRNATRRIAQERGEVRHWQFDDDYIAFRVCIMSEGHPKVVRVDGPIFYRWLRGLSSFGNRVELSNIGFATDVDSIPDQAFTFSRRVFNAHNMPTDEDQFIQWRGRMNDDLINAIETWRVGGIEISPKFLSMDMKESQGESGGNTDIYQDFGTVRKTAYAILIDPLNVKLVVKYGRYHHRANWRGICPKIVHEKFGATA